MQRVKSLYFFYYKEFFQIASKRKNIKNSFEAENFEISVEEKEIKKVLFYTQKRTLTTYLFLKNL